MNEKLLLFIGIFSNFSFFLLCTKVSGVSNRGNHVCYKIMSAFMQRKDLASLTKVQLHHANFHCDSFLFVSDRHGA